MKDFLRDIRKSVSDKYIYTDELRRLAWGTDAGFYRLIPKAVIRVRDESEVSAVLKAANIHKVPLTFRAAGTSLSGQAITDSVLVVASFGWENYSIAHDAETITMQPGITGARVNQILAPYGKIFSPDPASKASAMVGGIVINNASGMNCGTHSNSDKILRSMRIVLTDGTVVDTADANSAEASPRVRQLLREISAIRDEIISDKALTELILRKYSIKNVMGLNLRPFVAYTDPLEIMAHVMVGSEGTLAFMSEVTVETRPLLPFSASAMAYFSDMRQACHAVVRLKKDVPQVYSCEMLDKKSLASVHDSTGSGLTALLIETRAYSADDLDRNVEYISHILNDYDTYRPVRFATDPKETAALWQMRSGIFPAVGGTRPTGTTSLIEDIAFHIDDLPEATVKLASLIEECGYDDACIYGHALDGNYHFVIAQAFKDDRDVDKYDRLIKQIVKLVVEYKGSLKAEHGTGRNMAPFVATEWGEKAYRYMRRIKEAFDPEGLLNPGVIFNDDPKCYISNFKPLTPVDDIVDKCIECGFCEINCASCGLTLSARQRIVAQREISRLAVSDDDPTRLKALRRQYVYLGNETCAADGLCSISCPMGINTGDLTHKLRDEAHPSGSAAYRLGEMAAEHLAGVQTSVRLALGAASVAHKALGDAAVSAIGKALSKAGLPLWSPALPTPYSMGSGFSNTDARMCERKVVYFPSCINQTMGVSETHGAEQLAPLVDTMVRLCAKAGYQVIFPDNLKGLCCGMIWESKGMPDIADRKTRQLETALLEASENGKYPVLCDQSPCLHRMREHIKSLKLYEPAEFIADFLAPYLEFHPSDTPVAVHVTCSTRLMGLADKIVALARRCSTHVLVPEQVGCCGFAGDKGFTHPELNAWALRHLRGQIDRNAIKQGYSNSRTCEIGLTTHSGIPYQSIVYLVDEVTTPLFNLPNVLHTDGIDRRR